MRRCVGLDFGTTNSSLAVLDRGREVRTAQFRTASGTTEAFRSVLYFERPEGSLRRQDPAVFAGPGAIERYLQSDPKGRLIQSIKSFATSHTFRATSVFGRTYAFEDLVAAIVKRLVSEAEEQFGPLGRAVTVGRPVRFAGARTPDDETFALGRIRTALQNCGFEEVHFEYEPVGAAYHYESQLDHDELVLIADFGGGTSDFSLLRVGPGARFQLSDKERILGNEGVGVAGDTFDASIIRRLVSPRLGEGSSYRSLNKVLPVPTWVYARLERWHHLSFLKASDTMQMLRSVRATALEPEKLSALIHFVENDLGYELHRAVQETKIHLSRELESAFSLQDGDVEILEQVTRSSFEHWIARHLRSIRESVERLLTATGVAPADVDRVFLTGGSSFVPAVRNLFAGKFGAPKVAGGHEFTSVANGLALRAAAPHRPDGEASSVDFLQQPEETARDGDD
jgi:hypothetical chaperone protein